tara:strand:- start:22585 stop:23241 length:657 start_codon:yes stop_codon:yes gene_type:complete
MNGWIKIHRKLWQNPRAADPDWIAVWLYLLSHAAHKSVRVLFKGEVHELKPGQLVTGRKLIALNTGVHESKVFRVLKVLESEQQIEQRPSSTSSMITVRKWAEHQCDEQQNEQQVNSNRTANEQRVNTEQEGEELKKEKKKEMSAKFKKPTVEELKLFAAKSGLADDAERFHDHFESNGWKVGGRGAMKNWEAAYRNWSKNGINQTPTNPQGAFDDAW